MAAAKLCEGAESVSRNCVGDRGNGAFELSEVKGETRSRGTFECYHKTI